MTDQTTPGWGPPGAVPPPPPVPPTGSGPGRGKVRRWPWIAGATVGVLAILVAIGAATGEEEPVVAGGVATTAAAEVMPSTAAPVTATVVATTEAPTTTARPTTTTEAPRPTTTVDPTYAWLVANRGWVVEVTQTVADVSDTIGTAASSGISPIRLAGVCAGGVLDLEKREDDAARLSSSPAPDITGPIAEAFAATLETARACEVLDAARMSAGAARLQANTPRMNAATARVQEVLSRG